MEENEFFHQRGFEKNFCRAHVIEGFNVRSSQTISLEYFRDGAWVYDHKKHLSNFSDVMRNVDISDSE